MAVILQEMAAFPEVYDPLLSKGSELQEALRCSVAKIRSGITVKKDEITHLVTLLKKLGWQGDVPSGTLPLRQYCLRELYLLILNHIVQDGDEVQIVLGSAPVLSTQKPTLCKLKWQNGEGKEMVGDERFQLRMLLATRITGSGKHVYVYRKTDKGWICLDDDRIEKKDPAQDLISEVYYFHWI